MKKYLLILTMLISMMGYSQKSSRLIAAVSYSATANYTYSPATERIGSIQIVTSSDFAGTTGTIALKGSNDGVNFSTIYANDGVTALSFTLTAGNNTYVWELGTVLYGTYQLVYTAGNASAGTISATILTR